MENLPESRKDLNIVKEPSLVLEEARKAAKALNDVISNKKKPVIINGEQYLEYEDWATCARFYGITAKVISTAPITFGKASGFEAKAVALLVATGEEISAAEAMCLDDEQNWRNRPLFMLRSMAQTRAMAKALRNVLSWVVVLAGFKPTPAEEMEGLNREKKVGEQTDKEGKGNPPPSPPQEEFITINHASISKQGTNKKGQPWTLYAIDVSDGKRYGTFDKKIYEQACEYRDKGIPCIIKSEKTEKGNLSITFIKEYYFEEPGSEG